MSKLNKIRSFTLQETQIDYLKQMQKKGYNISAIVRQAIDLHKSNTENSIATTNMELRNV